MIQNKHYNRKVFQGKKKSYDSHYFEGWYFKHSTRRGESISFIPGVSYHNRNPHAFIQCIYQDTHGIRTHYFEYDLSTFFYSDLPFEIRIGNSVFSEERLVIDVEDGRFSIKGQLRYGSFLGLDGSWLCPNIMGFFSYIPKMECNHDIVSMKHGVEGRISYGGQEIVFNKGMGYIEKDWGRSFPSRYLWVQCNEFQNPELALTCSLAKIPMVGFSFQGFFCSLMTQDGEYRFATYNGYKISVESQQENRFQLLIQNKRLQLTIKGEIESLEKLASPKEGAMIQTIKEGLAGKVEIKLTNDQGHVLYEDKGIHAGIEIEL